MEKCLCSIQINCKLQLDVLQFRNRLVGIYLNPSLAENHNTLHSFYSLNTAPKKHHRHISYSGSYATNTSFIFYPEVLSFVGESRGLLVVEFIFLSRRKDSTAFPLYLYYSGNADTKKEQLC